jgi:signal peptidase I
LIAGGRLQQSSLIPSQEPEASKKKNPFWHDVWEIVETLILAVILYFAIDAVFARVRVENISMENTLMPGDLLVVNKLAYKFGPYHTGDIIIFHDPTGVKEDLIKRVIGTPGDTVSVQLFYRRNTLPPLLITKGIGSFPKIPCSCWEITAINPRIPITGRSPSSPPVT